MYVGSLLTLLLYEVIPKVLQLSGFELRHDASEELVNVEILGHFNDCSNCLNLLLLALYL